MNKNKKLLGFILILIIIFGSVSYLSFFPFLTYKPKEKMNNIQNFESNNDLNPFASPKSAAYNWQPNGTLLSTIAPTNLGMIPSNGGAIFTWVHYNDIYAQRVDADGNPQWGPDKNGKIICNATDIQDFPVIIDDGVDVLL